MLKKNPKRNYSYVHSASLSLESSRLVITYWISHVLYAFSRIKVQLPQIIPQLSLMFRLTQQYSRWVARNSKVISKINHWSYSRNPSTQAWSQRRALHWSWRFHRLSQGMVSVQLTFVWLQMLFDRWYLKNHWVQWIDLKQDSKATHSGNIQMFSSFRRDASHWCLW